MLYLSGIENGNYYITDTKDGVTELVSADDIKRGILSGGVVIKGLQLSITEDKNIVLHMERVYSDVEMRDYISRKSIYDLVTILTHKLCYFMKSVSPDKISQMGETVYENQTFSIFLNATPDYIMNQISYLESVSVPVNLEAYKRDLCRDYEKLLNLKRTV